MKSASTLLIETQYVGNIQYYARLLFHGNVMIEQYEYFLKSTYRNRCYIAMPDGKLRLSVPLIDGKQQRKCLKDVQISYAERWQKLHWNSICTAYRSSPFFEYYEDDLAPIYEKKEKYLLDFNDKVRNKILDLLQIEDRIVFGKTKKFEKCYTEAAVLDFRSAILPQKNKSRLDEHFKVPVYHQVFGDRTGFLPNLSVLDLLFSEGNNAVSILENSMK
ncbi:MAG: WbqC family protein [Chitinophagales bacterium]